ncbi:acetyltransferases [Clostridium sp. CAG:448]|nr:acetyltransferases [Clostridium sp. CAG:448]
MEGARRMRIRALRRADIGRVMELWLDANLKAHSFIPTAYWKSNFDAVKEMLPQAEVYVYEDASEIDAFVGLNGTYIEGIFVSSEMQSKGIGRRLLDFVKTKRTKLCLNVYQKNTRAIDFYQREGFKIRCEGLDESTGEKDYEMVWSGGQS